MFNQVIMLGNLVREIELRYLPSGGAVATSSIAVNRKFKKTDGSQGEEVCFIEVTFFGRTAEIANQYLEKGKKVLVQGRLKLDQWTDQQGVKRSKHSIVVESMQMLDSKQTEQKSVTKVETYDAQGNKTDEFDMPIVDEDIDIETIPF